MRIRWAGALLLLSLALAGVAQAYPYTEGPYVEASATNPLAGCPPDGSGVNFASGEVEPWVDVRPGFSGWPRHRCAPVCSGSRARGASSD